MKLFENTSDQLKAEAQALEERAKALRAQAGEKRREELLAKPLLERLTFAAHDRCACGAGYAYDPAGTGEGTPFKFPSQWECSDILRFKDLTAERQAEVKAAVHSGPLSFTEYELKSENQPSANGRTTRPQPGDPRAA